MCHFLAVFLKKILKLPIASIFTTSSHTKRQRPLLKQYHQKTLAVENLKRYLKRHLNKIDTIYMDKKMKYDVRVCRG
jgi:hypothetical protein